jgi:LysM repeat protein
MTRKIVRPFFILTILAALMLSAQAIAAQEDTAQLTFTKTAVSKKPMQTYTVQKGEVLSAIIRRIPGITEKDIPPYYRMIKELNPDIENLDRLYAGQEIVLPGKPSPVGVEKTALPAADLTAPLSPTTGAQNYQVKKGDSLIRIVHRELRVTSKTQPTLLVIKSMNPSIRDINKIYAGQILRLPDGQTVINVAIQPVKPEKEMPVAAKETLAPKAKPEEKRPEPQPIKIIEEKIEVPPPAREPIAKTDKLPEGKDTPILHPALRMAVIKHIVTQMNGTMMTGGNYYLPISKTEQLTIDCAIIPVVELDGSTIFLDRSDRSSAHLKKLITERWSHYHLINIDDKDDIVMILKKILKNTRTYEITKAQKPIALGSLPLLEVAVDWIIAKKDPKLSSAVQGLRFTYESDPLLPRAVVNLARKHSVFLTEISLEKGLVGKPEEIYSLPPVTILPASSARELSYALLSLLNIQGERDADIRVFDIEKDGFNLSIKADLIVTRDQKKYVLFSRSLPPQFVSILQKAGNELVFLSDQDDPTKTMETLLRTFRFATTSGYFSFSGLDKNQPPYAFGFNGTKIKTDKDIYVVNFNFNEDLRGLMKEAWSASIVRY